MRCAGTRLSRDGLRPLLPYVTSGPTTSTEFASETKFTLPLPLPLLDVLLKQRHIVHPTFPCRDKERVTPSSPPQRRERDALSYAHRLCAHVCVSVTVLREFLAQRRGRRSRQLVDFII